VYLPSLPLVPWNLATSEAYVRAETCQPLSVLFLLTHNRIHLVVYWRRHIILRRLTCDSAGANLDKRVAWRRHCRDGAEKERAANIFEGVKVFLLPNSSYTLEVASCRGG
jgi:hypothetical protein